jgi:hypothetical protein
MVWMQHSQIVEQPEVVTSPNGKSAVLRGYGSSVVWFDKEDIALVEEILNILRNPETKKTDDNDTENNND